MTSPKMLSKWALQIEPCCQLSSPNSSKPPIQIFWVCQGSVRSLSGFCQDSVRILSGFCQEPVRILSGACQESLRSWSEVCKESVPRHQLYLLQWNYYDKWDMIEFCNIYYQILLTQGPIPKNFAEIFWELVVLKISVFLSRPFWFFFQKKIFLLHIHENPSTLIM